MELRKYFTEHPASVGETYWEHFGVASFFARHSLAAAGAAAVHAVVPCLFETTARKHIMVMHERLTTGARGAALAAEEAAQANAEAALDSAA